MSGGKTRGTHQAAPKTVQGRQLSDLDIGDPQQLADILTHSAPGCSSILLPPIDGYDYLYLAKHGIISYQLMIGALQYEQQRLILDLPELSAEQIAIINALYSEQPSRSGRQKSVSEITDLVNKQRQPTNQLDERYVGQQLQQLWDDRRIHWQSADQEHYCLSPDIDFTVDDDQAPWLINYKQAEQLISELGLSGYYRFRGALLQARQQGIERSGNQQQKALIERFYQLSLARGEDISPWQEFSINEIILNADPGEEELLQLRAQLDDLVARGAILAHDSGSGQLFSLPVNPPGIARSEQTLPAKQIRELSLYTPVQYWRAEGRLRQATKRAQRRCHDDLFAQAVVGSIAILSQEGTRGRFQNGSPGSLDSQFTSADINDVIEKLGCRCSRQRLDEKLQQLSQAGIISARNPGMGPDLPVNYSLPVYDHPGKNNYLQPSDLDPDSAEQLAQRLRRRTPSGYYFRCGQALEAQASIRTVSAHRYLPKVINLLTTAALDGQGLSAEQLLAVDGPGSGGAEAEQIEPYLQQLVQEGLLESWVDQQRGSMYRMVID